MIMITDSMGFFYAFLNNAVRSPGKLGLSNTILFSTRLRGSTIVHTWRSRKPKPEKEDVKTWMRRKLDGVGPVDNRPSNDYFNKMIKKKKIKLHLTYSIEGVEHSLKMLVP